MNKLTRQIFEALRQQNIGPKAIIPPPFSKGLGASFLEYIPSKSVKLSFPVKERYNNPFGITFGGYFGVFFDFAFGPFSGLVAGKPTTSLDLNITFLKPLSPKDKTVIIDAWVVSKSKSYLILHAKAHNPQGILVATASTRMLILNTEK